MNKLEERHGIGVSRRGQGKMGRLKERHKHNINSRMMWLDKIDGLEKDTDHRIMM